jgi:uncharacterized protein (DUF952 family)
MAKAGMSDATAYKILTADEYLALQRGTFTGAPVDLADGYIHLSTAAQLRDTIDRHFAGRDNLMIAAIDLAPLGDAIRWEPARGGALFPHLYGPLPLAAVIACARLRRMQDGAVELPDTQILFEKNIQKLLSPQGGP